MTEFRFKIFAFCFAITEVAIASPISAEIDIDSWTLLYGKVSQSTCLFGKPDSRSECLRPLNPFSIVGPEQRFGGSPNFVATFVAESNPNWHCVYDHAYRMSCTGGDPYFVVHGYVPRQFFSEVRERSSCDGYEGVYLNQPSISCYGKSCEVDVGFTPSAVDGETVEVEIEVELATYDLKGNRITTLEEDDSGTYSVSVDFDIRDDEVSRVVVQDIDCERY